MAATPRRDDSLRVIVGGIAIFVIGIICLADLLVNGELSVGLLALLAGPVALVVTAVFVNKNGGGEK